MAEHEDVGTDNTDDGEREQEQNSGRSGEAHAREDDSSEGEQSGHSESGRKEGKTQDKKGKKPAFLRKPWFIVLLIVGGLLLLALIAVLWWQNETYGRFQQSTNDAYLDADQASIAARISGYVSEVLVADNQNVTAGQLLAHIEADNYEASADKDRAQIAQARAKVAEVQAQMIQQQAKVAQMRAQLAQDQSDRAQTAASDRFNRSQVARYGPLAETGAESHEKLAQYRSDAEQSDAQLHSADHKIASGAADLQYQLRQVAVYQAQVVSAQAQVRQGEAQLTSDRVDLASTSVSSRIEGRVGDRQVRVGQYVQAGTRLMTVVPVSGVYLRANFKETQIGLMRVGQPVTIKVDAVKGAVLHGTVESFSPGTGAQFALAPKDNATGNFTKIVQRVPVKIRISAGEEARKVLVPGLSATATVDTTGAKSDERAFKEESKRGERTRADEVKRQDRQDSRDHEMGAGHE